MILWASPVLPSQHTHRPALPLFQKPDVACVPRAFFRFSLEFCTVYRVIVL